MSKLRRALVALAATTLTLGLAPSAPASADDPWDVPPEATITLEGDGLGHGVGMSQYGAQEAAAEGLGYRQILRFYYPGTGLGTASGSIKVDITDDHDNDLIVHQRRGLQLRAVDARRTWRIHQPRATWWRSRLIADGRNQVSYRTNRWHAWRTVTGDVEFSAGGDPVELRTPRGSASYRGTLRSTIWETDSGPQRVTVNVVPLEAYLRGVVPSEVIASIWKTQALRAQAVAARGFAAHERATTTRPAFDVFDTHRSQVYGGVDAEYATSDAAVKATARQVLTYGGEVAYTQFSASNGGWTAEAPAADDGTTYPYLIAKQDPYDAKAHRFYGWQVQLTSQEIEAAYNLANLTSIGVETRQGGGDAGPVAEIRLETEAGWSGTVTIKSFFEKFDLRSKMFRISSVQ